MTPRFYASFDNDKRYFTIYERLIEPRVIADHIPTASWAEAMVEWMNNLELTHSVPELKILSQ